MKTDFHSLATPAHAFLESLFAARSRPPTRTSCLPPQSAGAACARTAHDPRRRQGGGLDGRGRRAPLSRRRVAADAACAGSRSRATAMAARPRAFRSIEAGHPVPDEAGISATKRALELADAAGADDLVLVLLSGGASANWIAPAPGLTLDEKQAVTRALLASGAAIAEINTVRKHLSRIKGGRLAERAAPAQVVTLAISDVPGDDPAVIGSGPTVPDPTTLADARAIVARYRLALPDAVRRALDDPANETPKPGDEVFAGTSLSDRGAAGGCACGRGRAGARRPAMNASCWAAASRARRARSRPSMRGWRCGSRAQGRRAVILSGGELTVTLRGRAEAARTRNMRLRSPSISRRRRDRGACRRHRRHRRRRRPPGRPGRRLCR